MKTKNLYHVSEKFLGLKVLFNPRIPDNRFEGGTVFNPYSGEHLEEDDKIKRICVSPSIRGCLKSFTFIYNQVYVYSPLYPRHVTRDMPLCLVPDAKETKEHWILTPTYMKYIGMIQVDDIHDINNLKYKWIERHE
jgi:hypothetical protein